MRLYLRITVPVILTAFFEHRVKWSPYLNKFRNESPVEISHPEKIFLLCLVRQQGYYLKSLVGLVQIIELSSQ